MLQGWGEEVIEGKEHGTEMYYAGTSFASFLMGIFEDRLNKHL